MASKFRLAGFGSPSCWLILAAVLCAPASSAVLRVVPSGGLTSSSCGTTWANACTLQTALGLATSGDQVWVKKGVYTPGTSQSDTFTIKSGVKVYGGFMGSETLLSGRDPAANVTILSGDIDGNDTNTDGNSIDETYGDIKGNNSYHVVTMDGTVTPITSNTILDGFTVTGGDSPSLFIGGGGLLCDGSGSASALCSPALEDLTFSGNLADFGTGGAVYDEGTSGGTSSPGLVDVTFRGNAAAWGGAIGNDAGTDGTSSPLLINVTFSENAAVDGGAMLNNEEGSGSSSPTLLNVTFSGNSASNSRGFAGGGAIANFLSSSNSRPTLTNVIVWGDSVSAGGSGPEIYNEASTSAVVTIRYSVVQGSGGSGVSWDSSLGSDGGHNLDTNPWLGPLQNNGGATATMALLPGSSAIDGGVDNLVLVPVDQRGVSRPQDGNGDGLAVTDIGAYEVPDTFAPTETIATSSGDPTNVSPIPVSITFSEPVTGLTASEFTVTDGSVGNFSGSGASYTLDLTPTADGPVTIELPADQVQDSDGSGNNNAVSNVLSITYDTVAPTESLGTSSGDPTNVSPIPVSITFSEPVTGLTASEFVVTDGSAGNLSGSGASYTMDVTPSADETVTVELPAGSVQDAAGNGNTASNLLSIDFDSTAPRVGSTSLQTTYSGQGPSSFTVSFSEPVTDTGIGGAESVTNPANYLLVEAGANGTFDTQSCQGGVVSDDSAVPISGVTYDAGAMSATAMLGNPLALGTYRLFVCGTTSITDIAGNKLNGGSDATFDFSVAPVTAVPALSIAGLLCLAFLLLLSATAAISVRRRGRARRTECS